MPDLKDCPRCGQVNSAAAAHCPCGWEFPAVRPGRPRLVCPDCGGNEYTICKSQRWVSFVNDRKCRACGTRYSVPTPAWAALLFLLVGLAMLLVGSVMLALYGAGGCPFGLFLFGWFVIVGGAAVWHGGRSLVRRGEE